MVSLDEYKTCPCATLSIPYWKQKTVKLPENVRIVHDSAFCAEQWRGWWDERYFRLLHDLQQKENSAVPEGFFLRTARRTDFSDMAKIINQSYEEILMTEAQLEGYTRGLAYFPDGWVMACAANGTPVGCGIADLDPEAEEGALEWIQVLPECRRQGLGAAIVRELLRRLRNRARFATVSGRVGQPGNPEGLYRRCGFIGNDVWHILRRE